MYRTARLGILTTCAPRGVAPRDLPSDRTERGDTATAQGRGGAIDLDGWGNAEEAKQILRESMARYETSSEKPKF